mmetsp:Transcript_35126/g.57841  ORF Transcript_35126/g.57841 Transcript_35126/m.57841 type:complete len:129 (-) Transcript_35126:103-489(-)
MKNLLTSWNHPCCHHCQPQIKTAGNKGKREQKFVVVVVVVKSSCPAVVVIMVWETICPWQVKEMTVTSNSNQKKGEIRRGRKTRINKTVVMLQSQQQHCYQEKEQNKIQNRSTAVGCQFSNHHQDCQA